jgi:hypothetical protein
MRSYIAAGIVLGATLATMGLATAAVAASGVPDKNGIIWDDPKPAAIQAAPAPAVKPAPAAAPSGALDNAGITWNPPAKPSAARDSVAAAPRNDYAAAPRNDYAAAPRNTMNTTTAAVSTAGPCHEFQTTIVIDGQKQPAHGTVCQQADGSWRVVDK